MEALVRRYHASLFGYAFRLVRDYHAAQDLVQEAFFRLCRSTERMERPGAVRVWLHRVVTNLAADWGKRASNRREIAASHAASGTPGSHYPGSAMSEARTGMSPAVIPMESILEQREDRLRLTRALRSLTEEQRIVIYLRFYQDLSLAQIAEALEIPVGTVKSRLHNGLKGLYSALTQDQEKEGTTS